MDLSEIRQEIDAIDDQLVQLFCGVFALTTPLLTPGVGLG